MPKTILNYCDRLDKVQSLMKTKEDNVVTVIIIAVYVENDTKLS